MRSTMAFILTITLGGCAASPYPVLAQGTIVASEQADFLVQEVATGLENPWSLAFLPDGRMLVTERPGRLRLISSDGELSAPLTGLPEIADEGQGGLLDVILDPEFETNNRLYLSYSARTDDSFSTHVATALLRDSQLSEVEEIFKAAVDARGGRHFGSRLAFDQQGHLLITHGDRGDRHLAQDRQSHAGSVIRIATDGTVPADNPYAGQTSTLPTLYTLGHRNPQGMAIHPETGQIWTHEHGPRGGDEINILVPGANYGWPIVSQGAEYASGRPVSDTTSSPGLIDPIHVWIPSVAPSGMAFYTGSLFSDWQGDLFVGALADQSLVRLELDGSTISHEERLLSGDVGRIRDVRQGPDDALYLLIDDADGSLLRLMPAG